MDRIRLLAIGTMLLFALPMLAQQTTSKPGDPAKSVSGDAAASLPDDIHGGQGTSHGRGHGGTPGGMPTVEEQLKVLTEKLNLTGDQQAQIKPILRELHDATQKLMLDKSLSRLAKVRPQREKADKRIRAVLNQDQKQKLDQYEQGPHSEMHGNLHGTTQTPRQPPTL